MSSSEPTREPEDRLTFLDPEGHPMKWDSARLTHTHEDGSPICELPTAGFSLGPGESREIEVMFERPVEVEPPIWAEYSVPIGDRKNRMPWGLLLLFAAIGILAGWAVIWVLSGIV
jgi:hypothetical protein